MGLCLASPHLCPGQVPCWHHRIHSVTRWPYHVQGMGCLTTLSREPILSDRLPGARHCLST